MVITIQTWNILLHANPNHGVHGRRHFTFALSAVLISISPATSPTCQAQLSRCHTCRTSCIFIIANYRYIVKILQSQHACYLRRQCNSRQNPTIDVQSSSMSFRVVYCNLKPSRRLVDYSHDISDVLGAVALLHRVLCIAVVELAWFNVITDILGTHLLCIGHPVCFYVISDAPAINWKTFWSHFQWSMPLPVTSWNSCHTYHQQSWLRSSIASVVGQMAQLQAPWADALITWHCGRIISAVSLRHFENIVEMVALRFPNQLRGLWYLGRAWRIRVGSS